MQTCSRTNTGALDNNKQTDYTVVDVKFEAGESTQSSHDLINEFIGDSDTGDTCPENRRKRKYPQKLSMEEHDQQHDDDEEEERNEDAGLGDWGEGLGKKVGDVVGDG